SYPSGSSREALVVAAVERTPVTRVTGTVRPTREGRHPALMAARGGVVTPPRAQDQQGVPGPTTVGGVPRPRGRCGDLHDHAAFTPQRSHATAGTTHLRAGHVRTVG